MSHYKVIPNDNIYYIVTADFVESSGDWLIFYIWVDGNAKLVHACSSQSTQYVTLQ